MNRTTDDSTIPEHWLPVLALTAACVLWGSAFYFAKIALDELSVMDLMLYRFGLAAPILVGLLVRVRAGLPRKYIGRILLTGVLCVPVGYLIHIAGLERTSVTHASLLVGVGPALLALAAFVLRLERVGRRDWTAIAVSSLGILVMVGLPGGDGDLLGDGLVLISMIVATAWILLGQDLSRRLGATVATAWILLVGTVALLPLSLVSGPPPTALALETWLAVVALSIGGTVGAFFLWNWGVSRYPTGRAGVFLNLEPVVGVLMGVALLGESTGVGGVLGGGMILSAAVMASTSRPARRQAVEPAGCCPQPGAG